MGEFMLNGGESGYIIHSHPNAIRKEGEEYITRGSGHSTPDQDLATGTYAHVVLEVRPNNPNELSDVDKTAATTAGGNWVNRTDSKKDMIDIYNDKGTLYREDYSTYKKTVDKINKTPESPSK